MQQTRSTRNDYTTTRNRRCVGEERDAQTRLSIHVTGVILTSVFLMSFVLSAPVHGAPYEDSPSYNQLNSQNFNMTQVTPESILTAPEVRDYFCELWRRSNFGFVQQEKAAFLLFDGQRFRFHYWGANSNQCRQQEFLGDIPLGVVAIVHTHPNGCNCRPSPIDRQAARQLNVPNYVISRKGVWCYDPIRDEESNFADASYVSSAPQLARR